MNYKITFGSQKDSKNAQQLLFTMGYEWVTSKKRIINTDIIYFDSEMELSIVPSADLGGESAYKNITLSELRAMASTEKEYINKTTGEYRKTSDVVSGEQWVEIPKGADLYGRNKLSGVKEFYKKIKDSHGLATLNPDGVWIKSRYHVGNIDYLWTRAAKPEALPFVDDEPYNPDYDDCDDEPCSINDQYAEIEKVRQDVINKPNHYASSSIECIDAMQAMMTHEQFIGFLRGNVFKYQWRYDKKNGLEDLKKSQWYLDKLMSLL